MPLLIDSAPECITQVTGAKPADDSADFIIQAAYEKCAGIMTFGHGSTYGAEGTGATTQYMILTWIGIIVCLGVIALWIVFEDRRLWQHAARLSSRDAGKPGPGPVPSRTIE